MWREAARILRERLVIERSCGSPLEGRGVVAEHDARTGVLRVWASTQAPLTIRNGLAHMFGLPEFNVEVIAPDIGGGFGTKIMLFYPEEILVPFAAMRLGRPVKWTEDRREHLIAANQERGQIHHVEVAVDEEGRILALRDRFLHDTGAYTPYGIVVPYRDRRPAPRPLPAAQLSRRVRGGLHEHGECQPLSRGRTPARGLRDGARHGSHRARVRPGAGRGASP